MRNIVEVARLNDGKCRIYELPADYPEQLNPGRLVDVDFAGGTTLSVVKVASRTISDEEETLLRDMMHMRTPFAKVRKVYPIPVDVDWSEPVVDLTVQDDDADGSEDDAE